MPLLRPALLLVLLAGQSFGLAPPSTPAIVEFPNGDRLSGLFMGENTEDGTISFRSPLLGDVTLPTASVTISFPTLGSQGEPDPASALAVKANAVEILQSPPDPEPLPPVVPPPPPESTTEALAIPGLRFIRYPKSWEGNFRLGVEYLEGRTDTFALNFQNDLRFKKGRNDNLFGVAYFYKTQNSDRIIQDQFLTRYRLNINRPKDSFLQSETTYEFDHIRDLDTQVRQTLGYGLKWNKPEKYEFSLVPGFSGSYSQFGNNPEADPWKLLGRIYQGFNYRITDNYSLNQSFEGFMSVRYLDTWDVNFKIGLLGSITAQLALELNYTYDYDSTVAANVDPKNTRLFTSVVYRY